MGKVILEAQALCYSFPDGQSEHRLIDQCNFKLNAFSKVAIIGSSGSGKTSLLQLLSGLNKPTSGQVSFTGQAWSTMSQHDINALRMRDIGFVYQDQNFFDELSVLQNVMLPLQVAGVKDAKTRASDILHQLDIPVRLFDAPPNILSGGEASRVGIARALVHQPKIVFADEPTSSLDHQLTSQVFTYMNQLYESSRFALVVATHDHSLLNQFEYVYHLTEGQLQEVKSA